MKAAASPGLVSTSQAERKKGVGTNAGEYLLKSATSFRTSSYIPWSRQGHGATAIYKGVWKERPKGMSWG